MPFNNFYEEAHEHINKKIKKKRLALEASGKMKSYKQGEHNLWIRFDQKKESEQFVRDVGLDHLAFELKSEKEVDEIHELIKKLDVKITREPKKYPQYTETYYAFYFRDPNGIPLEVYLQ